MFLPPVLQPVAAAGPITPAVQRIGESPFSVVRGVRGSYVAERLAGVIDSWDRLQDCVWLRAGDARPVELAQSLAAACRHRWSPQDVAASGPGARLGEDIQRAPEGAVIVLDLGGRLTPAVTRLVRSIRPAVVDRGVSVVVVAESWFQPMTGRRPDWAVPTSDLIDREALEGCALELNRSRLFRYTGRRTAVLHDVVAAAQLWSQDAVSEALDSSHGLGSFLDRLTAVLVRQLTPDQRSALHVALTTGYWHPQLGARPVPAHELRPWLVPLEQQWGWLRPIWVRPLRAELARPTGLGSSAAGFGSSAAGAGAARDRAGPDRPAPTKTLPATVTTTHQTVLEARLLGPLEVRVDGSPVHSWSGQRGTSVLRYLLSRRGYACSRDELLEEFWPNVALGAARNRLQVAVSGLRRAFLDVTGLNVVEYADGRYRVNPTLRVELDIESFEALVRAGNAAERAGAREGARRAYRQAVALYRGDFAADAPFEQWTLLPRESMRLQLVDALDRLSRMEFDDRSFDDCIATAHRMLDIDPCREDAHRLLMRCYAGQGRVYLALRQYTFCARVLRATVDVDPAADTTRLYHAIRLSSERQPAGSAR